MSTAFSRVPGSYFFLIFLLFAATAWGDIEPMVQCTSDGVPFITGGVGKDERTELKKQFKEYNCRIELANKFGEYLYKAKVSIRNAQNKEILKTDTAGPWILVRLPEGEYSVVITHKGTKKTLKIAIEKGKKNVTVIRF